MPIKYSSKAKHYENVAFARYYSNENMDNLEQHIQQQLTSLENEGWADTLTNVMDFYDNYSSSNFITDNEITELENQIIQFLQQPHINTLVRKILEHKVRIDARLEHI